METNSSDVRSHFWSELRLILVRSGQVWSRVPFKQKWMFGAAALLMFITGLTSVGVPVFLGKLVDDLSQGVHTHAGGYVLFRIAGFYLGIVALLVLTREVINVIRRYVVESTCTRIEKNLSVQVIAQLLKADLSTLTHEKIGSLNGRISRNVGGYMRFLRAAFLDFFPALLTGLMALVAVFYKAPWMGLVMAAVVPVSVSLTAWQLVSQKDIRLKLIRSNELVDGTVVELLGGLDYVRVADTHQQEVAKVDALTEQQRSDALKHHVAMALFGAGKALTEGFFHLLVLSVAVYLAVSGQNSFGDILTFSALFMSVMTPVAEVHRILDEGHEAALRVGDLISMMEQPLDRSYMIANECVVPHDDTGPVIEIEELHVAYKTSCGKDVSVLTGVEMKIMNGETVGVVGRSGCGKSTLIKVLMRVIHPNGGRVRLRGIPLDQVSRSSISELIGYVGQSPFIFSGSIEENIRYGCSDDCDEASIREAAIRACIHDEIVAMPEGYSTKIAERGSNISGGQRQRIALARIFLKDPPILILDEATSALDTISERIVQQAIEQARSDRTVIMIAHRLSSLQDTDRIFVFDSGRIVEQGNYQSLIEHGGIFTELAQPNPENSRPLHPSSREAPAYNVGLS
ncbi:ABC transporter ATP-binding protein [Telmatocola sphagniphila]|uniref:Multidrug resistance-like ATP-binding protein MdlB n=1 Tax=Telmatocola sphagniphila TaxID=1123043 RepID=A0A8E6B1C7_9BACT|nr:ABC transporter ATP-binding protein [Telmatocola sphagniphila]QVL29937.1 ABC transporter ATP-binding protein [Telmatocola sphagniphila]